MKLIIQNIDGEIYAATETERVFKRNEKIRGGQQLDPKELAIECDMAKYVNSYFVFDIK